MWGKAVRREGLAKGTNPAKGGYHNPANSANKSAHGCAPDAAAHHRRAAAAEPGGAGRARDLLRLAGHALHLLRRVARRREERPRHPRHEPVTWHAIPRSVAVEGQWRRKSGAWSFRAIWSTMVGLLAFFRAVFSRFFSGVRSFSHRIMQLHYALFSRRIMREFSPCSLDIRSFSLHILPHLVHSQAATPRRRLRATLAAQSSGTTTLRTSRPRQTQARPPPAAIPHSRASATTMAGTART